MEPDGNGGRPIFSVLRAPEINDLAGSRFGFVDSIPQLAGLSRFHYIPILLRCPQERERKSNLQKVSEYNENSELGTFWNLRSEHG